MYMTFILLIRLQLNFILSEIENEREKEWEIEKERLWNLSMEWQKGRPWYRSNSPEDTESFNIEIPEGTNPEEERHTRDLYVFPPYPYTKKRGDDDTKTETSPMETSNFSHLWELCDNCYLNNYKELAFLRQNICQGCEYHLPMHSSQRIDLLIDPQTWDPMDDDMISVDPIVWDRVDWDRVDKTPVGPEFPECDDWEDKAGELVLECYQQLASREPEKWGPLYETYKETFNMDKKIEVNWDEEEEVDSEVDSDESSEEDPRTSEEVDSDESSDEELFESEEDVANKSEEDFSQEDPLTSEEFVGPDQDVANKSEEKLLEECKNIPTYEELFGPDDDEEEDKSEEILLEEFKDTLTYPEKNESYQKETGMTEAIQTGLGKLNGIPVAIGIMDFQFMGGTMGSVVGEKITCLIEYAAEKSLPLILVCASGGARMQEGSLSLAQMGKISSASYDFQKIRKKFYMSILTSPTTGGVTASFGMLGDIIITEPNAYIAFAGKRVIEETLKIEIPEGSQDAEPLFEAGLFDLLVPRNLLKRVMTEILQWHGFRGQL
uniref:acetyl-CoA carboxylase carboxyltransferase beta subunit n=1 Tax=Myosurus apetalus TaxID=2071495 RepID=UPI0030E20194